MQIQKAMLKIMKILHLEPRYDEEPIDKPAELSLIHI